MHPIHAIEKRTKCNSNEGIEGGGLPHIHDIDDYSNNFQKRWQSNNLS